MKNTENLEDVKWGFLRETSDKAVEAGLDGDTGIKRTGLNEYLLVIFPKVNDWVYDHTIPNLPDGLRSRKRPDYRSESLRLIIEFDGLPHYQKPNIIRNDEDGTCFYKSLGYRVVRIPFFIQLTNKAVERMFGISVTEPLFNEAIPSLGPKGQNTPAFLCGAGVARMAEEFRKYPEQYLVNLNFLKSFDDDFLTGVSLLEKLYTGNCEQEV